MKYQIKSDKGYYSRSMSTGKAVFYDSNEMGYTFTKEEAEKMLERLEKETGKDLEIVEYKKENMMANGGEMSDAEWQKHIQPQIENLNRLLEKGSITFEQYQNAINNLKNPKSYEDGGGIDSEYEDYEIVVISKDAEKDGGGTHRHNYLVSAKNIKEAKEIATEMFYEEWGDADFYLFEVMSEDSYRNNYMADGGNVSDSIAMTILKQLGGMNRLIVMTGAYNFVDLGDGVSFKIKNQRANYIKIKLNSMDLYDLEVGRIRGMTYKAVASHKDIYFDQLKPLIEKATGMYLSLAKGGDIQQNDVFDPYVPPTPEEKAAKQQKQAEIAKMAMMFAKDGAEIIDLNVDKLDMYERMRYDEMIKKGISKKSALQILINDVDGDYSQLSPELKKYAIFVYETGGRVHFKDKVNAISKRLEGTKVPKRLRNDYGLTYDKKESEMAAKRIVGSMIKKYEK